MTSDFRNDIICNSNSDIMEYLIQKLESRRKNITKYANIINLIDSFESFYQRKKDIFLLFSNLEEELHQASLAIKALVVQNKALSKENTNIIINENNYNKLLKENNYLLKENNKYARQLKELNNKSISPKRSKSPTFGNNTKTKIHYVNKNKNKYQPLNKNNNKKFEIMSNYNKNINNKNNVKNNENNIKKKEKNKENIYNYDLDLNDIEQLKNAKNIIKDMKKNKNKLKEVIDEHFGKNQTQGNRNNNYWKND